MFRSDRFTQEAETVATPDQMAAVSIATWRGHPLPKVGRHVKVKHRVTRHGHTRWSTTTGFVAASSAHDGELLTIEIHGAAEPLHVDSRSALDGWSYTGDTAAEHAHSMANDPIYRHHYETLSEEMGLRRIAADAMFPTVGSTGSPAAQPVDPFGEDDAESTTAIPDPDAVTTPEMLRRLLFLKSEIESLEAQLKAAKDEYARLNASTVQEMAGEGCTSMVVDGQNGYLYPKTHVERVPGATPDDVLAALQESELRFMVKTGYNAQTLKAYLIECRDNGIPVPQKLADLVSLETSMEVRFRRAAARKRGPAERSAAPGAS